MPANKLSIYSTETLFRRSVDAVDHDTSSDTETNNVMCRRHHQFKMTDPSRSLLLC